MTSPRISHAARKVFSLVLFGLVLVGLFLHSSISAQELWDIVGDVDPLWAALVVLSSFALVFLTALKWRIILRELAPEQYLPLRFFIHNTVLGLASAQFASHAGTVAARSGALKYSAGMKLAKGAASVLLDQLYDYMILLFMLLPSMAVFAGFMSMDEAMTTLAALIPLFSLVFILSRNSLFRWLLGHYNALRTALANKPLAGAVAKRLPAPDGNALAMSHKAACALTLYSLIRIAALAVRMYFIALCFGLEIPFVTILLALPVVMLATSAGLGFAEAGIYGIMLAAGIPAATAFSYAALCRIMVLASIAVLFAATSLYSTVIASNPAPTEDNHA